MKIWTTVKIREEDKNITIISNAMTNYLYKKSPITDKKAKAQLQKYTESRIAGLLTLYLAKDYKRLKDIVNKYYNKNLNLQPIVPELEGYVEKR